MKKERHGDYGSPEYVTWIAMKGRCHNENHSCFKSYGAVGISVCERWRKSYVAFLADMGRKPDKSYTIDRIESSEGYHPGNCRWADAKTQSRNRSICKLTKGGVTKNISDWAEELGITTKTIRERRKRGLPIEEVLSPPTPRNKRWSGEVKFWEFARKDRLRDKYGKYMKEGE